MNYSKIFSPPGSRPSEAAGYPGGFLDTLLRKALRHALTSLERTGREDNFTRYGPKTARNHMVRFIDHAVSGAATFGGVTGALGFVGVAVELPLFYIQACKHLAQTSLTFGFDPHDEEEQDYILALLAIGHLPTLSARRRALEALQSQHRCNGRLLGTGTFIGLGRRLLFASLARIMSPLRLFRPVTGAALNSSNSARLMDAILKTALMAYQKRSTP